MREGGETGRVGVVSKTTQRTYNAITRGFNRKKSEVDSANASGTQALTLRRLSHPRKKKRKR